MWHHWCCTKCNIEGGNGPSKSQRSPRFFHGGKIRWTRYYEFSASTIEFYQWQPIQSLVTSCKLKTDIMTILWLIGMVILGESYVQVLLYNLHFWIYFYYFTAKAGASKWTVLSFLSFSLTQNVNRNFMLVVQLVTLLNIFLCLHRRRLK